MAFLSEVTRRGTIARWLMLLAATASAPLSVAQAESAAGPGGVTYPVKIANGLSVDRGSDVGREYCIIRGIRARPRAGTETGSLYVNGEVVFDEKANAFARGHVMVDVKETSFTNFQEKPVQVRIDLDGKTYDMPQGSVHQAVFTFLEFIFPLELLNDIAAAKVMKVYTVDQNSKAPVLFATADIGAGQASFEALGKCFESLPELPSRLPDGWQLHMEQTGCMIAPLDDPAFGVGVLPDAGDKKEDIATLFFVEKKDPYPFTKPVVRIGGHAIAAKYTLEKEAGAYQHYFIFAAAELQRITPGAALEISDNGKPIFGGSNLFPKVAMTFVKKCAASVKQQSAKAR